MSNYEKQNFEPGQVLTAAQLNHIEEGIEKILPAIEGNEQQLVTDTEGNLVWEKKLCTSTTEPKTLFSNIELTGEKDQTLDVSWGPYFIPAIGSQALVNLNGTIYETDVRGTGGEAFIIGITQTSTPIVFMYNAGVTSVRNVYQITGQVSIEVYTVVYDKIDVNYLPSPAVSGNGFRSIKLTNGYAALADGFFAVSANNGHAQGRHSFSANVGWATGNESFACGSYSEANGTLSFAQGLHTIANSPYQHVEGKYNIEDIENKYAHIIGNGTDADTRSNAHTLDWSGNAWFAGTMEGTGVIVKSSTEGSNKRFKITVDDSGTISATEVTA